MHVLIIPSWYPEHAGDISGSFFREQALALHKYGCKVGVIYPQHRSLRQLKSIWRGQYGIEQQIDGGMPTLRYHGMNWFPRMRNLARRFWVQRGLKLFDTYIKQHGKPDVVHAHSILNGGVLAMEISKKYGIPFAVTEHSSAYALNLLSENELKIAKIVATTSKIKFAVSRAFCSQLESQFAGSGEWIFLPNIVNEEFLKKEIQKNKNKNFCFINIAFANKNKNQDNIIRAFAENFINSPNVRLIIGGDGPELESLRRLAINLGIAEKVEFTGRLSREQVLQKMSESDAFVLSSRYETFGVVVIEALALGLPVIATRCGGPESIVREQDGILVPVGDVQSLAKAMQDIYTNFQNYDRKEIRESCRLRFSEKAISEKLILTYQTVVAGKN